MADKKIEQAVAVLYDKSRADAPQIVASGKGKIAEKIIEVARTSGVYIKEDPDLLELLAQVPVGDAIPIDLYQAIAEVLAFVYRLNTKYLEH